ncbi:MAG: polysaccharide biosynthesis tyrosine autokinase, partial [Candidatus Thorarchaeota archaeon]
RDSQLKLEYQVDLDLYKSLLENLYQVGILEAISLSDIHLIEWARVPDVDKPASPKKGLIGIIALFLGVVSGFGLCFLMEYLDDTIRKPGDTRELGLTLIGVIPLLRGKKSSIISKRDPRDPICETYRTVRNRLKLANRDRPIRTLLVMSSLEGEGKTTVAVNLGISITREGKQVLLMDTDFWKPTIHELFGVPNSSGITNILAKETSITNDIIKTDVEGLSILTSGPVPPDPGRVIESGDINGIIRDLAQQYDAVILDSPAILSSSDAIVLAGYVHYSLLVMESGKLTRRALSDAAELLHSANIKAVGAILNKLR